MIAGVVWTYRVIANSEYPEVPARQTDLGC